VSKFYDSRDTIGNNEKEAGKNQQQPQFSLHGVKRMHLLIKYVSLISHKAIGDISIKIVFFVLVHGIDNSRIYFFGSYTSYP